MGKVLITGSSGFLGSNILKFIDKECILQYYNHMPKTDKHMTVLCDLENEDDVFWLFQNRNIDTVIHLASIVNGISYNRRHPAKVLDVVTKIDANVMNAAHEFGVTNFIYTGTLSSYGYRHDAPLQEEEYLLGEPEEAVLGYGSAKRYGYIRLKTMLQEYDFRSHHPILPNLYGLYDNFFSEHKRIIPAFMTHIVDNKPIVIFGTGKPIRDFLWAEDAARYLWNLTNEAPPAYLEPINISYGHGIRIKELVDLMGHKGKVICDLTHRDPAIGRVLDNSKLIGKDKSFSISYDDYIEEMKENLECMKEWFIKARTE